MVDRRLIRRYRPFGATFVIDADDERFHHAARFALARYPATAGLPADLRVELVARSVAGDVPAAWPSTRLREQPTGITLDSGMSSLAVRHDVGHTTARLDLETSLLDDPYAVRVFVEAAFWSAAIGGGHLHAVHSGLVVGHGTGLLLRGQSGAGKSTLTYACLRRGMRVVSDDWVYAPGRAADVILYGSPWLVWLTIDGAARFAELAAEPSVPHPGSDRVKVPVHPPVARRRIAAGPDVVVFVEPSEQLRIDPIGSDEAHERFEVSALDTERGSLPRSFVDALLDRPSFVLGRGTSPDDAAAALHGLARDQAARRARTTRS